MEWEEKYEQGVIWQDFQHKQFIDNLNILLHMVTSKEKDERAFNRVANFTIQYCNNHFKTEELYMKKHAYPRIKKHTDEHKQFVQDLKKIISDKNFGNIEKASTLLNKLMSWFVQHILETDKYLAAFIKKHNLS